MGCEPRSEYSPDFFINNQMRKNSQDENDPLSELLKFKYNHSA